MTLIIGIDRDGTLIDDSDKEGRSFPGCTLDWKERIVLLSHVVSGIKILNKLPDAHCFIITNQGGVALINEQFKRLTKERAEEVNQFCIKQIAKQGAKLEKSFSCYMIETKAAEKYKAKGWTVDEGAIDDACPDLKPNPGMLLKACTSLRKEPEECTIFMIGDRLTDVQAGISAGGQGILVPGPKTHERGDLEKTKAYAKQHPGRVHIVSSLQKAAELIRNQLNSI